jgi:hypothetical protein
MASLIVVPVCQRRDADTDWFPAVDILLKCSSRASALSRRLHAHLLILGAALAMLLLSGCASTNVRGDSDPWQYNPNTGYPAVGGPSWGHC